MTSIWTDTTVSKKNVEEDGGCKFCPSYGSFLATAVSFHLFSERGMLSALQDNLRNVLKR